MTNTITRKYNVLVIEDLDIAGMMAGPTPRPRPTPAWEKFDASSEYKRSWRQVQLILAHRQFPSSKLFSSCQCHNAKLKRAQAGKTLDLPDLRNRTRPKHERSDKP